MDRLPRCSLAGVFSKEDGDLPELEDILATEEPESFFSDASSRLCTVNFLLLVSGIFPCVGVDASFGLLPTVVGCGSEFACTMVYVGMVVEGMASEWIVSGWLISDCKVFEGMVSG
jgi:hypothetical protein